MGPPKMRRHGARALTVTVTLPVSGPMNAFRTVVPGVLPTTRLPVSVLAEIRIPGVSQVMSGLRSVIGCPAVDRMSTATVTVSPTKKLADAGVRVMEAISGITRSVSDVATPLMVAVTVTSPGFKPVARTAGMNEAVHVAGCRRTMFVSLDTKLTVLGYSVPTPLPL